MSETLTLGSLFDGIGGFCLAGQMAGIRPVWASEIEPFPIRTTEVRFPSVIQLGDVHGIHGGDVPPVDIITFGSPCQNLSVAGKRTGLNGEQSSLFFEAIRIIKEMRQSTDGKYPRWAVWENVPGALSSNEGRDFRAVLQSLAEIKAGEADVPMPGKGKWLGAGEILGDDYSVAWRILDAAKGWGVAQRRRRIFAVLDLDGQCAGKVLFESEGLSGYSPPGETQGKGTPTCPESCAGAAGFCTEPIAESRGIGYGEEESPMFRTGLAPVTMKIRCGKEGGGKGPLIQKNKSATLAINNDQTLFQPVECKAYAIQGSMIGRKEKNGPQGGGVNEEVSFTLNTVDRHAVARPAYATTVGSFMSSSKEKAQTLMARDYKDPQVVVAPQPDGPMYIVRRLTPIECLRLQGYPDEWFSGLENKCPSDDDISRWTDIFAAWNKIQGIKPKTRNQVAKWLNHPNTDAAEYKAIGNSVAVPCVHFVLAGIVWATYDAEHHAGR